MIQLKNLYKIFYDNSKKEHIVLKDISLEIEEGELVLLQGVSGSGKSTLLHILAGLLKPTKGLVLVEGENIASYSDYHASLYRSKKVAYIAQSFHLFDELSVEQNLLAPLVIKQLSMQEINAAIQKALEIANIAHKADEKVANLSGGEKQRCVIARAVVNDADIILCDEPTANLDRQNSLKFIGIIEKLKESGKTIIIATHDPLFQDLKCVDREFHLKEGQLE